MDKRPVSVVSKLSLPRKFGQSRSALQGWQSFAPVASASGEDLKLGVSRRLEEVAELMFRRYRAVSGDTVPGTQYRNIAVVGAGASHAACGLPLAASLAEKIEGRVLATGIPPLLIDTELQRLQLVNRLRPRDFETRLLALGKFDSRTVLDVLRDECDIAHYPSLTYEILAHLLKHGFLDAIVNFNFDELLDQAIEEEVGPDRYVRIVRDGGWSRRLRADENDPFRFDAPLYIKPHGTVSEPESLRFTRDAYFALPPDTARLLRVLLHGLPAGAFVPGLPTYADAVASNENGPTRRVSLLVIGHALGSFEFNKLMEASPKSSRMHVVARGHPPRPNPRDEWPHSMKLFAKGRSIPISEQDGALDRLMAALWMAIEKRAEAAGKHNKPWLNVRGVARHKLVAHLFAPYRPGILLRRNPSTLSKPSGSTRKRAQALSDYLFDRFVIELTLAVAKAKGFADIRELHRGRPGRFFRLLSETVGKGSLPSFTSTLERLGMERRDASSESYCHKSIPVTLARPPDVDSEPAGRGPGLTLDDLTFYSRTRPQLARACRSLLTEHREKKWARGGRRLFDEALEEMFKGGEVEIAPQQSTRADLRFSAPLVIHTVAGLRRETASLLADKPWDLLLCVAESGEWLLQPELGHNLKVAGRTIGVIIADTVVLQGLRALPMVHVERLPWHLHNRHMTIRLRGLSAGFKADRAIYFERRYRSAHISPVVLTAEEDLEQVMDDFTVYWLKAKRHQAGKSEAISCTRAELHRARLQLLGEMSMTPNSCGERSDPLHCG